jgi:hypothetical protein
VRLDLRREVERSWVGQVVDVISDNLRAVAHFHSVRRRAGVRVKEKE